MALTLDPTGTGGCLIGRVAIVTGGSRGLGRAVCHAIAEQGATVVVASRSLERSGDVAREITAAGGSAAPAQAEMGSVTELEELVAGAVAEFGRLDMLVNNAAILKPHVIERLSTDEFDELYAVNVKGPVFLSKAALPHLRAAGTGVVLNISALGGIAPMAGIGAYSSTKAAMLSWTRVMAKEWAPFGIRVNALVPGPIATEMILPRDPAARAQFMEDMSAGTPLGRVGEPVDFTSAVVFLVSSASSYMTGQALVIDGGMLA